MEEKNNLNPQNTGIKMGQEYSEKSKPQKQILNYINDLFLPKILSQISKDTYSSKDPFYIADYGCAQGKNSLLCFYQILDHIFVINPQKSVIFIMNDVPANNFSDMFEFMQKSVMQNEKYKDKNIIFLASGNSYFGKAAPQNCINIAFCSCAIHWLSVFPGSLPKHFVASNKICNQKDKANYSQDELLQLQKWIKQAQNDWENFLENRFQELSQKDGYLIISIPLEEETIEEGDAIYLNSINTALEQNQLNHLKDWIILNSYLRNKEELLQPFNNKLKNQLELQDYQVESMKLINPEYGSIEKQLKIIIEMFKSVYTSVLLNRLHTISNQQQKQISDETCNNVLKIFYEKIYEELLQLIQKNKPFESVIEYMLIKKI